MLGQETTGPGGIAYALRTVPVMLDIAETIRRVAPNAYLLNFTNPAGIITEALQSVLGDHALGICDTPSGLGRRVAGVLGYDHTRIQMDYVGLNHLGWMRRVLVDGVDVLPVLLADGQRLDRMEEAQIFGTDWIHALGVIPNEYLYYYYFNRDAVGASSSPRRPGATSCWRPRDGSSPRPQRIPMPRHGCGPLRSTSAAPVTWPRPRAASRAHPPSSRNARPIPPTSVTPVWRSG